MTTRTDALDRVLALSQLVGADLDRFQAEQGLSTARVHLLWVLGASGAVTQRELADALRVTPRNVTGLVDGLVGSGHVTRVPHPTDRRATLVTPTPQGEAFAAELRRGHEELAEQLFGALGEQRLRALVRDLDAVTARFAGLMEAAQ